MSESKSSISASNDDLVPKKGANSIVWKWFGYRSADLQPSTILCKICKKTVTAKGGNATNLFHHLKQKKHGVQPGYEVMQKKKRDASSW